MWAPADNTWCTSTVCGSCTCLRLTVVTAFESLNLYLDLSLPMWISTLLTWISIWESVRDQCWRHLPFHNLLPYISNSPQLSQLLSSDKRVNLLFAQLLQAFEWRLQWNEQYFDALLILWHIWSSRTGNLSPLNWSFSALETRHIQEIYRDGRIQRDNVQTSGKKFWSLQYLSRRATSRCFIECSSMCKSEYTNNLTSGESCCGRVMPDGLLPNMVANNTLSC